MVNIVNLRFMYYAFALIAALYHLTKTLLGPQSRKLLPQARVQLKYPDKPFNSLGSNSIAACPWRHFDGIMRLKNDHSYANR